MAYVKWHPSQWIFRFSRQEVTPLSAVLRTQCYFQTAPKANSSSAGAHLINYALHCVTDRLKDHKDLRMSSLRSVNNLVSLPLGDKSQYKWGSKQPVRRRRGDVHKDLTALAFRLHWEGEPHDSCHYFFPYLITTICMWVDEFSVKLQSEQITLHRKMAGRL